MSTDSVSYQVEVQDPRSAHKKFRPDIEGLRAVAVLAVVLFHADVPGVGGGFVGVDVFFVISGFLITGLLWREVSTTGSIRLRGFYGARARRLLPASATVGVVTMIASAILLPLLQVPAVLKDGIASALYVSNYRFVVEGVDYFGGHMPPSPFQHYWSLGVEEQFYLIWPPLILGSAWLIRHLRPRAKADTTSSERPYLVVLLLVSALSFALSLVISYQLPAVAFFSLPTRAWQLAAGGLVALAARQWRRLPPRPAALIGAAGMGAILWGCNQLTAVTLYPGVAALLPTLGAVLVIGAGCAIPTQGCGRLLGLPPMRAIGRVSYSWYLWHWPAMIFAPALLGHPLGLAARVAAALASGGLAVLTLRFIENPLRYALPMRRSPLRSLAVGGLATAFAVCVGVALLQWIPVPIGRGAPATPLAVTSSPPATGDNIAAYDASVRHAFAEVRVAVEASAELKTVPSNLQPPLTAAASEKSALYFNGCMRTTSQSDQPECATGDTASTTTVALVGDSHAAMWNPAFQRLAIRRPWRLEMMAKTGCPLMDLPITSPYFHREDVSCEQWRGQILARLRAERTQLVMVGLWRRYDSSYGFTPYDPAWINSLTRLVQQLRGTGAKVLVLGPVPDPQSVVPICLSGHLDAAAACASPRSAAVNQTGIAAESAATRAGGGQYADLTDLFCTTKRCPVIVGNTLVYSDWSHVTTEYSRQLAPVIESLADRALAGD